MVTSKRISSVLQTGEKWWLIPLLGVLLLLGAILVFTASSSIAWVTLPLLSFMTAPRNAIEFRSITTIVPLTGNFHYRTNMR